MCVNNLHSIHASLKPLHNHNKSKSKIQREWIRKRANERERAREKEREIIFFILKPNLLLHVAIMQFIGTCCYWETPIFRFSFLDLNYWIILLVCLIYIYVRIVCAQSSDQFSIHCIRYLCFFTSFLFNLLLHWKSNVLKRNI